MAAGTILTEVILIVDELSAIMWTRTLLRVICHWSLGERAYRGGDSDNEEYAGLGRVDRMKFQTT